MKNNNIFLIIPTIRTLDFLTEWKDAFKACHILIIEDHQTQEIPTPKKLPCLSIQHYTWEDIKNDFGKHEWIFSRKNAGIRSYGFWKAYQQGADIIITIDDDCYPVDKDFVDQHIQNLSLKSPKKWINTYPHRGHMFTRGFPYNIRDAYPVIISHGLWTNQIDHDAQTQLKLGEINLPSYPSIVQFIPQGVYFPMCSMNLAFRREAIPLMYFPLMGYDQNGNKWGYDRFDDIWAGIFAKKICDHLGYGIVNGSPFVEHRKASDAKKNLIKEREGIKINEILWEEIENIKLKTKNMYQNFQQIAETIKTMKINNEYFKTLGEAMSIWIRLFH